MVTARLRAIPSWLWLPRAVAPSQLHCCWPGIEAVSDTPQERVPGFRRRFIVTPAPNRVSAEVEDDYHCMGVTIHHDGKTATEAHAVMLRAPWQTCPGAVVELKQTFTGVPLDGFAARGAKKANCTHLHDLAVLACIPVAQ